MKRPAGRRLLVAAAGGLLVGAAHDASAYCRAYTCSSTHGTCPFDPNSSSCYASGDPLSWHAPCVGFSLQQDASSQVSFEEFQRVADAAFATWQAVRCDDEGPPTITVTRLAPASCDKLEYNPSGPNANVIMFRDETWPHENAESTYALTTTTYSPETGEILDADMEINGTMKRLDPPRLITTGDQNVDIDLQSIITHEAGHFVGLAHSPMPGATMFYTYNAGQMAIRELSDDDRAGVCAIYPRGRGVEGYCDPTPARGFASACDVPASDTRVVGCAFTPGPCAAGWLAPVLALGAAYSERRRRRPGCRREEGL